MLFVIHLLSHGEHRLRLSFWNHSDAIAIRDDDIPSIDGNSVAHHGNLRPRKPVVMHRGGGNDAGGKDWESNLAQIGDIPHSTVDHRSCVATRRHRSPHQAAHSSNVFAVLNYHHVHRIGRPLIDGLKHSRKRFGVVVALVFLELDGSRKPSEFSREDRLHAMAHVHLLVGNLLQRVGNGGYFHMSKLRNQFAV